MSKLFVIGNPVDHSKSPVIHNFWLKRYSINIIYEKKKVEPEEISNLINKVRSEEIKGFNITIPFKKIIFELVDEVDETAFKSLAINTVYQKDGKVIGTNTDGVGFVDSLQKDLRYKINNKTSILILGAGGAAYGIISELIKHDVSQIQISNRTEEKANKLINHFCSFSNEISKKFKIVKWGEDPSVDTNLIVNSTACGMKPSDNFNLELNLKAKDLLVYDIIYDPPITTLMKKAESKKLNNANGIYMLIRQAAESFNKWFGIKLKDEDIQGAMRLLGYYD